MRTTKLAAVLFTDVSGFDAFFSANEAAALAFLAGWRPFVTAAIGECGGKTVDTTGDEILAVFDSAVSAVQAALLIRDGMGSLLPSTGRVEGIASRTGIHSGEIWMDGERAYGDGVNVAARMKGECPPGSILVSGDVKRQIATKLDVPMRALPARALKNIEHRHELWAIDGRECPGEDRRLAVVHIDVDAHVEEHEEDHEEDHGEEHEGAVNVVDYRSLRERAVRNGTDALRALARSVVAGSALFYCHRLWGTWYFLVGALVLGVLPAMGAIPKLWKSWIDRRYADREIGRSP